MIDGSSSSKRDSAGLYNSLLNGIGSFASSLFGLSSQKEENQKNRDFALEMWNRQNEYNTPKHQRELLEEGGYNPYALQEGGVGVGQASSPLSPSVSPLSGIDNPVAAGLSQYNRSAELNLQALQVESNLDMQRMKSQESFYKTALEVYKTGGKDAYDDFMRQNSDYAQSLNFENSPYMQRVERELRSLDLDNSFKELENRWYGVIKNDEHRLNQDLHRQYQETLNKIKAEIRNLDARTDLTYAEKEKVLAEKMGVIIENGLKGLDFENAKELQGVIQDTAYENLWKMEDERYYRPFDKDYEYQGKTGQYFPFPSGQFGAAERYDKNRKRDAHIRQKRFERSVKKK